MFAIGKEMLREKKQSGFKYSNVLKVQGKVYQKISNLYHIKICMHIYIITKFFFFNFQLKIIVQIKNQDNLLLSNIRIITRKENG